ncbi:MAG: 2,3-bisphosphoglycerate-independent phosphoglycerate mutase [Armatimonadetes bacterium]|nr:2,3-bisphosphoglycerate-independent phosphoglycerate mutase [Armatimonadota bacterium]MDW8027282.1 2,3-bisphosphoglycerate-independent phosphoglycerate mutase [Armatimonadota bacterium]
MREWTYEGLMQELTKTAETKILLVVLDGLGGLPISEIGGKTELEASKKPNLDELAKSSMLGLLEPVLPGISPGSSAGHFALFGYDPLRYYVGRGVLEALGIGFPLQEGDVAIRANFATAQYEGNQPIIVDRRAGRPKTEETERLCAELKNAISEIDGVQILIEPVKEHRFVIVLRGEGLGEGVRDTDPQVTGRPPLTPQPEPDNPENRRTAEIAVKLIERTAEVLRSEPKANYVLLRGFAKRPNWVSFSELYKLNACCIAVYPMYRGLAQLVGMKVLDFEGDTIADEIAALKSVWNDYDFFFLHIKPTDSRGEDGNWQGKIAVIEEFDKNLPDILALKPDVLAITGDHSTPATYRAHSWHPVPVLLHSRWVIPDPEVKGFGERTCAKGTLGRIPSKFLMSLLLAHAERLERYQA